MRKVSELREIIFEEKDTPVDTKTIIDFLNLRGTTHNHGYFHYTTVKSLLSMIKSQKFHLSAGSEMNDLLETQKGSHERWKKLYISSFSFGSNENMAMWGIYGDPLNEALRLKFSCANLNKVIKSAQKSQQIYCACFNPENLTYSYEEIKTAFTIKLVDVIYYTKSSLEYDKKKIFLKKYPDVKNCTSNSDFTGYLKNQAWFYENETRIVVEFEKPLRNVSTVAIDFSEALQSLFITSSPCNSKENLLNIINNPEKENIPCQLMSKIDFNIEESIHKGYVHFRKRCNSCTYEQNKRNVLCPYEMRFSNKEK